MRPFEYIKARQFGWARRRGITLDEAGFVEELNDNLFLPLTDEIKRELPGDGDSHRNMFAVHSSAALVLNVFSYWRLYGNPRPIISAIRPGVIDYEVQDIRFEARCPINWPVDYPGPRRTPPHLDVVIRYRDQGEPDIVKAIAVESKFREPYGGHRDEFAPCYLADGNADIWRGLEPLQRLAGEIRNGESSFRHLHVAQLIKHVLGLNSEFGGTPNFELLYLWMPASGPEAVKHEEEIARFVQIAESCSSPIQFRGLRYDDLIDTLTRRHEDAHRAYINYLTERYF